MAGRAVARRLALESIESGKPLAWFEDLYLHAAGDPSLIPWADMATNPNLAEWLETERLSGGGQRALIVGCGLGDDAEALAAIGFEVTAFDISPACIEWCRRRFPDSNVQYQVADLFARVPEWNAAFDFVFEAYTLQVLPPEMRQSAIQQIAQWVAPGGALLVITRGRDEKDDPGKMPWPLVRDELESFTQYGLAETRFDDYVEAEDPPVRRFRIQYRKTVD